jgi:hypothetical protein
VTRSIRSVTSALLVGIGLLALAPAVEAKICSGGSGSLFDHTLGYSGGLGQGTGDCIGGGSDGFTIDLYGGKDTGGPGGGSDYTFGGWSGGGGDHGWLKTGGDGGNNCPVVPLPTSGLLLLSGAMLLLPLVQRRRLATA